MIYQKVKFISNVSPLGKLFVAGVYLFVFFILFSHNIMGYHSAFYYIAILLILGFFSKLLFNVWTDWAINDDEIRITWTRKNILFTNNDVILKWNELSNIRKYNTLFSTKLCFDLISGETVKFVHDHYSINSELGNLYDALILKFNDKNIDNSDVHTQ